MRDILIQQLCLYTVEDLQRGRIMVVVCMQLESCCEVVRLGAEQAKHIVFQTCLSKLQPSNNSIWAPASLEPSPDIAWIVLTWLEKSAQCFWVTPNVLGLV